MSQHLMTILSLGQIVLVFIQCCYGQPTIRLTDWMSTRSEERTFRRLQKSLDYILLELRRQTNENRQLKRQLVELQNKVTYQDDLLFNLSESVLCRKEKEKEISEGEISRKLELDISMDRGEKSVVKEIEETTVAQVGNTEPPTTKAPQSYFRDCYEIQSNGTEINKTFTIKPDGSEKPFEVLCEMHENVAWNVIQRRLDGSVDFYRSWSDYKNGFGTMDGEFWLGNENIHFLTTQARYKLKVDMWDWKTHTKKSANEIDSNYFFAESNYFRVDNETNHYRLHVPEDFYAYTGYSGSGLRVHSGPFVTYDIVIPYMRENCAIKFHCGWWFTTCVRNANLNGRYYNGGYLNKTTRTRGKDDIYWPNIPQSLMKVQMKLARVIEG